MSNVLPQQAAPAAQSSRTGTTAVVFGAILVGLGIVAALALPVIYGVPAGAALVAGGAVTVALGTLLTQRAGHHYEASVQRAETNALLRYLADAEHRRAS